MKGLVRNNFYMVDGSLKAVLIFGFISAIIMIIATLNEMIVIESILGGIFGGCGALAGTAIQKDAASKWNRFELTLPISRIDVIKARYTSFILYNLIAAAFAIFYILVFYVFSGYFPLERIGFGLSFGLCFALLLEAFIYPLSLIFGSDKLDTILFIAATLSLGIYFGASLLTITYFSQTANIDLIFRVGMIALCIILFILSYLISAYIYTKKEI